MQRGAERIQCEIRAADDGRGFELVWSEDGRQHVERSPNPDELATRWLELEQRWKRDGWTKIGE